MKGKKILAFMLMLVMLIMLTACGNTDHKNGSNTIDTTNSNTNGSEERIDDSTTETMTDTIELATIDTSGINLNHTYTTRFEEVNFVTYPAFSFDYPDGWTVTLEDVTTEQERVTLANDRGVKVDFLNIHIKHIGGGGSFYRQIEISKVADASFVPGYVQATDYSDLGNFIVAELKTIGTKNATDSDFTPAENDWINYAVVPESLIGVHKANMMYDLDFAFWYSGNTILRAEAPKGQFTDQEKKEVVAILSSFRETYASYEFPEATGTHSDIKIEELWELLAGEWIFEEYKYRGKPHDLGEHTLEFKYIDGKPCMSRDYQSDNRRSENELFYDFTAVDESHYNAYTYKRGGYGGEGDNWSSDVGLVWWSFDLSNLSDGELVMIFNISYDSNLDNYHTYKYSRQ